MKITGSNSTQERWRKSVTTADGTEKSVEVRKIKNGFIAEIRMYNYKEEDYKPVCEEVYFKDNPLGDLEPEIDSDSIEDFLNPKITLL
jgi:hypothetical protein